MRHTVHAVEALASSASFLGSLRFLKEGEILWDALFGKVDFRGFLG
jgi:hypothetical protein